MTQSPGDRIKPREFWLDNTRTKYGHPLDNAESEPEITVSQVPYPYDNWIHVIEYSAYAKQEEKLKIAIEALKQYEFIGVEIVTYEDLLYSMSCLNYVAREALEKISGGEE